MRIGRMLIYSFLGVCFLGASVATSQDPTSSALENVDKAPVQVKVGKTFPLLENLHWSKGGSDNVIIADFLLVNRSKTTWKDVMVSCDGNTKSGTRIGNNTVIIFETLNPGETKKVNDFNMGVIDSQVAHVGCKVMNAVEVK